MAKVRRANFIIIYNGKNITADLTPYLIGVEYRDYVTGKSDSIEISLEDTDRLWQFEWYPAKGDMIKLQMGYDGVIMDCGEFEIDEIAGSGPPDKVVIRALASWVTTALRTKNSFADEGKTLKQIAERIAAKHGLTVVDGTQILTNKTTVSVKQELLDLTFVQKQIVNASNGYVQSWNYTIVTAEVEKLNAVIRQAVTSLTLTSQSLLGKGFGSQASQVSEMAVKLSAAVSTESISDKQATINQVSVNINTVLPSLKDVTKTSVTKTQGALYTIRLARSTQYNETDLQYLARISGEFGLQFSVKGKQLVFTSIFEIEKGLPVIEIDRSQVTSWDVVDKVSGAFSKAGVTYHDPKKNKKVQHLESNPVNAYGENNAPLTGGDTLDIRSKAEDQAQAEQKAKAGLYRANSKQRSGMIKIEGTPLLVAGMNFVLTSYGFFSGIYHIESSRHCDEKTSGYETELEIKQVGYVSRERQKSNKKPRKEPQYTVHVTQ